MTACQPFLSDDAYVHTSGEVKSSKLKQELTEAEADIVQISMRVAYIDI